MIELEDEADAPIPVGIQFGAAEFAHPSAFKVNHPTVAIGSVKPTKQVEQGALTAPASAEDRNPFAGSNLDGRILENLHGDTTHSIGLAQAAGDQHGLAGGV